MPLLPKSSRITSLAGGLALCLTALACTPTSPRDSPSGEDPPRERLRTFNQTVEAEVEAVDHIRDPASLRWAKLEQGEVSLSCVDGRAAEGVLGSPGGDAGELLLLLAAAEAEGARIDLDEVPSLIEAWIDRFGSFYMHTDADALTLLREALAADPRVAPSLPAEPGPEALEAWLREPPVEVRELLLAHLIDPAAVGCGHLRSILRAPDRYGIRPELVGAVISGFYQRLWTRPEQLRFVVLHGEHDERAVLDIEVAESGEDEEIPLILPKGERRQAFVIQPQAVAKFRSGATEVLAEHRRAQGQAPLDAEALAERIDALGQQQLEATLDSLGVDVPTIRVVVDREQTRSLDPI
jgi:hypothetical protein